MGRDMERTIQLSSYFIYAGMSWSSTFLDLRQKQSHVYRLFFFFFVTYHVYRLNDPFVLLFSNVNKSFCLLKSLFINVLKKLFSKFY